ncbi:MAG TPA: NHL repeat-containing protein [Bacteroidia bacterium]|jgi:sugar lactone lactonase YvrE|nr:NHL repeat-containing protein [Bacteroidia bacterium]
MRTFRSLAYIVLPAFSFFYSGLLNAQSYTISTVVGSGMNGYGGNGGLAVNAELNTPCSIAADSSGNIYVADDGLNTDCIRKITTAGIISTLIGGRSDDFAMDDDEIIKELNYPTGIALDKKGNIYIADKTNNRIQKLGSDGAISTIAGNGKVGYTGDGGPGTSASLKHPMSVTADAWGNIYIADAGNNCIRKINAKGIITTIAGTGEAGYTGDKGQATAAKLNYPNSVYADVSGNIFIADEGNNCIRKINSEGVITTIAGNGKSGYSGDGNAATDGELGRPTGVTTDNTGNIYIADWANNCIRKVDVNGIISTFAGTGKPGFSGDSGKATLAKLHIPSNVSTDNKGNIYIVDFGNHRVRKVDSKGMIVTIAGNGAQNYFGDGGPATAAELYYPSGIAVDAAGNIYNADKQVHRIHKTNANGIISIIAGSGTRGYKGDGGPSEKALINSPSGIKVDAEGNLYIADVGNHCIRKINSAGIISTIAGKGVAGFSGDGGPATAAAFNFPYDVAPDNKGNIYIADYSNHRIRKVDSKGIVTTIAGNGTIGFSGDGGSAINAEFNFPIAIAIDGTGNIYVSDQSNNRIRKIDTKGIISTIAGKGTAGYSGDNGKATLAELNAPIGIVVDADGNIYFVDSGNNCVRMINAQGIISTLTGDGTEGHKGNGGDAKNAELNSPYGIAIDTGGNIYISDQSNNEIRKLTRK